MIIAGVLLLLKTAKKTMCCYRNVNCYQCQVEGLCGKPFHLAELHVSVMILTTVGVQVSALTSFCFLPGFNFPVLCSTTSKR